VKPKARIWKLKSDGFSNKQERRGLPLREGEDKIPMHKLLKDYPLNEWIEAADGCEYCKAKYQVRITWIDPEENVGDVEYRIRHEEDCLGKYDLRGVEILEDDVDADIGGWTYMEKAIAFRGLNLYPLKSRANLGPCLICEKLVVGVPLILFIDEGRGGELNFCFGCAEEKGILREVLNKPAKEAKC